MNNFKKEVISINSKEVEVYVDYDKKDIYMSQNEIVELYGVSRYALLRLLNKNKEASTCADSAQVQQTCTNIGKVQIEGNKEVTRNVKHYNLSVIKEVGYKLNYDLTNEFLDKADGLFDSSNNYQLVNYSLSRAINYDIRNMIYVIRGVYVMLDFELAMIYGYETKSFNQQVKNNIDKFPLRYRFKLTKNEFDANLRSKFLTSSWGGSRYLPYAFTEQGIYMLMTVLKGELATKQSINIIDTFTEMKKIIMENRSILLNNNESTNLTNLVYEHSNRIEKIENKLEIVMDNFIDPSKYKHYLIMDGKRIEADIAYQEIYSLASESIYIVDDYIDVKTLQHLKACKENINIIILSDNKAKNSLNKNYILDFINDTNINITFKKNNNRFHDRYIFIDFNTDNPTVYHCGASSKDSGKRINTINKIEDTKLYYELVMDIKNSETLEFN